ncbi:MAG: HEPN domain-containing protein [Candidatus Hadarchaeales archaeon]
MGKKEALDEFIRRIRAGFGNRITGIYLYGSMAKGKAEVSSDIDVLLVYKDIDRTELLDKLSDLTFDLACKHGEVIEPIILPHDEFRRLVGRSPFLWEVLEHGRTIFEAESSTEWKFEFEEQLKLAEEYLRYARRALDENEYRLAIDTGYNSIELLIKALIISTKTELASSHGGVLTQFGDLFIKTGRIEKEVGRDAHRALILRAQARYVPSAQLTRADAEFVVSLAEKILGVVRQILKIQ